jgi:IclR family acetate operon transcriptional repressor
MLAHLPDEEVQRYCAGELVGATHHTITSPELLWQELAAIRRRGYATNPGEWHPDACGIAAPVLDNAGYAVAAIGVACPAARFTPAWVERVAPPATEHAREVSSALGYRGPSSGWPAIS